MHEMSLTESIVRIIEEQAITQDFAKVKTLWLEIGTLSHVDPDSIRFCFDAVSANTICKGAQLEILRPTGMAWCMDCSEKVEIAHRYDDCPKCGGSKLSVVEGEEMRIKELEVE